MSPEHGRSTGGNGSRSVVVLTAAALLLLIPAAVRLASVNAALLRSVELVRSQTTAVPNSFGSLIGLDARDGSEWVPSSVEESQIVLFTVSASTAATDIAFWHDVASRSQRIVPDVKFVGVCDKGNSCDVPPGNEAVTILSFMSPLQMRSLAIARKDGLALIYRERALSATLVVSEDEQTLVAEIVRITRQAETGAE